MGFHRNFLYFRICRALLPSQDPVSLAIQICARKIQKGRKAGTSLWVQHPVSSGEMALIGSSTNCGESGVRRGALPISSVFCIEQGLFSGLNLVLNAIGNSNPYI